ncbi:MAG: hypothetical protein Q8K60_05045 [Parachlamydiaceae bacterium]|nr:hypothetical protein [Parachlamydiaceae bacterium]
MHSKHLIQNKLYQNTISVLIKVVSKENEKEMNLLWNCVKKYVLNNSKEDLFLFFINQEIEFIKKFEFPLTITNQITEKFWKSSQLSFNEWLFLISLIESSTPKKLTLLASWWQKLNSLPVNDNFHKLIEKSNHFFPKIEHTDDPLLFLQCKYNLISCYKKINHPTIINFLNETDYLYYPFQNNQLFEIKEKICSLLLDGAISFITNQDNDHIFNSIFIHQKKFSEELFKHNLIARNQWNQKFNYKILNSLERSYSIQDQINCCFIIKLMISTIQQEGLPDPVFLKFLKKKMQIFMDSNDSIEKTNSKYPQIYEDIISFSKWICTHPKISMGFINEVLISISNTSQDSVILSEVFYTFLFSTKTSYDLTFIRQNFFHTAFVALGLKDVDLVNSYSHLINLFEEKQKNLNDNESILKGKYHFFLFDHYFNQKIKTIINHEDALESVDVFAKHAPFILIEPKLFDKCLQNTLFFAKTYHNKNFQFLMETNQQNFNVFIYKLLLIKSLLINYPVNKFQKIIFKTIDKDKDLSELLNNFLHEYIHQLFINHETFPQKNFIANFLHTITFLYPPYFKIINLQENQNLVEDIEKDFLLKHWIGFNKIISNAETLNIFENEKNKLSQIKIWISLNNEPFYNMKSEDIIYVIHQFCSFKSYECTQNAVNNLIIFLTLIKLAKALEPTSHKRISESLANLYQKVIKNILNIENEQNKISMFSQLVKETFKFEDNNSLTSHFGTLFYPYIKNMIISLPKDIKNKSLTKCLLTYINIIYKESSVDLLKNGNNLLIEKINFILPYVRKNLVQDTVHCKKSENTSSSLNNLVERIAILLTEPSITHPKLNIPINRSKRELLFTLLESICQQFPGDLLNRKCAILIHLFTHILVNCKDFFFWFDTSNSKKNEKIKKNMLNMVNELGTPLEKKILKSLFIHYQSNLEDRIKNIHYLQETLNFNPNDFTLDESLKIFEFLFFSFTMWKPQDSKKRFFFLIENPVLEQQQLFENSLHTLKLIIENSSNNNSLEFLKEFIMQSFETQWLTPNRGLCTEFVIWARTKIDSINTGEPIYKLLCLVFDFEIHLMIGNEMDDFWIERVKYFKELFNPLRELVVKEKKLSLSWILVHLICKSTTKNTRKIFFNKWLEYLTEIQPPSDLLELHIKDITQYCNNFPKIQKNNFLNEYDKFNNLLFDLSTFLKDFSLDIIKESDSEIIE